MIRAVHSRSRRDSGEPSRARSGPIARVLLGAWVWIGALGPLACGDGSPAAPAGPSPQDDAERAESTGSSASAPPADPIAAVEDCDALSRRAEHGEADLVALHHLCPGIDLSHSQIRTLLLATPAAVEAHALVPTLDAHPELQGLARLATLDRSSQAPPSELPDPATALLTPIDDRILAAVELAHATLARDELEDNQRTRAHAFLAQVYLQALDSLGLPPGRPLPAFARLLAGPALFHARSFCRFYWQRRVAGLEHTFADTELRMLELLIDLDNTAHAGDPALLAIERQRTRVYLQRSGPSSRIARRARSRPDARGLGSDLLLPFVHELDRLFDHGLIDPALDRAMHLGAASGGYGIDPVAAAVTEDLRERDLREYERRLGRRVERARRRTHSSRHRGSKELDPELPVEWPEAAEVALEAQAWLAIAHGRAPDFARRHALARAVLALRTRPDAVRELLGAETPAVVAARPLLLELLVAFDEQSLASLRARVAAEADDPSDAAVRRRYALAARDALLHPR